VRQLASQAEPVYGMTLLTGELYLLRPKERDQVEVYDVNTYCLLRCLTVPDIRDVADMTSCEHYHYVYISDHVAECVHRVDLEGTFTWWAVNDEPRGLSVTATHNVLVTCYFVRKIKEFSSDGKLVRGLMLPDDVINPWHAIQTGSSQFIVCHGGRDDRDHRVCMISADGRDIVHSHGGRRGSDIGQYNVAGYLAVDDNEFVFVADVYNRQVTLLSPTLEYVRQVVSRDQLKWLPLRLCLDTEQRLMYVADNEREEDKWTKGRVVVFRV